MACARGAHPAAEGNFFKMQNLHIPLGRPHTTRPLRRVVWLAALLPIFLVYLGSLWWFTRPDIGNVAPEGTVLIVRLMPSQKYWNDVASVIGELPIVSGHGLSVRSLIPYTHGDLTLFIGEDGRRSAALRTKAGQIPRALLDSQGISVQQAAPDLFLLGDHARPFMPISLSRPSFWLFSFGAHSLGYVHIRLGDTWLSGRLQANASGWQILIPHLPLPSLPWRTLPENTIAAMATPVLTKDFNISGITGRMDALLSHFDIPLISGLTDKLLQNHGLMLITQDNDGLGMLMSGMANQLSTEDQKHILTVASALKNPVGKRWILPDNTSATELNADPSGITIDEKTLFGTTVLQAKARSNETLLIASHDNQYALTNREPLILAWIGGKIDKPMTAGSCRIDNSSYLNLQKLFAVSSPSLQYTQENSMRMLAEQFSEISIRNSFIFSIIQMCF